MLTDRAGGRGLPRCCCVAAPVFAATPKQKMEICKFGADNQKLTGAERKKFMANCMANTRFAARQTGGPALAAAVIPGRREAPQLVGVRLMSLPA